MFRLEDISEFAICPVVRHSNVNSIQNPSTVTNPSNNGALLYSSATYVAVPYNVTNRKLTINKIVTGYGNHS